MLEWFAGSLVLVGLSMVLSLSWLRRAARQYVSLAQELTARRADIGGDVLSWFAACRTTLEQAGVNGLRYRGLWFGGQVEGDWGERRGERRTRMLNAGDLSLTVELWVRPMRGERRMLREGVLSVFDLLLQQSVLAKSEAVAAALAQQAELSLYLQHDLKNLTQWVLLVTDQFAAADDDQLLMLARHLREHAPLARQRAERLVDQLSDPRGDIREQQKPYDLLQEARIFASLHGLDLQTPDGALRVALPKRNVERILDPLFASLAGITPPPKVSLDLREEDGWTKIEIRSDRRPPISLARLFEPRIRDEHGLPALGLYQSRTAALSLGGGLTAQPRGEGLVYALTLPSG
ncbi:hypothetical protein [Pseudomarimonas salicorniae]|uniref:Uncharacterized protein n=1 Tax=Pseudomarimonas salicorniae TaxID=2933270 RepID=A0ABT0GE59_9GAMM|nr:hypothetical protein [Lysobacter sp. CAU 1642]MCK7592849.1 hypothetical protein [Lysobacter sp. CAU 1642]